MTTEKRVLIVDDHPIVRDGLAQLLDHDPDLAICGEAACAEEAQQAVESCAPDIVLVDISLGGTSGIELVKWIRSHRPDLRILIVSMHEEASYAERALGAGAHGYVHKQEGRNRIREAVRTVAFGGTFVSPSVAQKIVEKKVKTEEKDIGDPTEILSKREMDLFELIGQGYKPKHIGAMLGLSVKTVENYRVHIREKFRLKNAEELTRHAVDWLRNKSEE